MPLTSVPAADASQRRQLDAFFSPRTVAVIGATEAEGSVGATIFRNLVGGPFASKVFPVNPKRATVFGVKACPRIEAVPEAVDLAVVVTPAATVPGVVSECVVAGVKGSLIISAGFKEAGATGAELERRILDHARRGGMRVVGPNCVGIMNPITGLNATFAGPMARPGNVALISQSGAMCTAILDWSRLEQVGFSAFVSIGSMLDVGWGDLIDYLGDDPNTHSIVIYMESIGDARAFLSAAREVALNKPIIVIKAGRTEAAAKAAASHTGALTGSDEVLDAAFRRCGVLRVNRIADLFYMAELLGKQPRPEGPRLTILTNAGGPGVLATDALVAGHGELAPLSEETKAALDALLPPHWSHGNPIDVLGDADAERYVRALEIAAIDPSSDGLLVVLTPQGMTSPAEIAQRVADSVLPHGKPILASWMGGADVSGGVDILNRAGIPTFPYPDSAALAFTYMWQYSSNLRGLYETPTAGSSADDSSQARGAEIIHNALRTGRTILTELESKQLLAAYGIPVVPGKVATSESEAVEFAAGLGYPVVLKLFSKSITHKTDVGGVRLSLGSEASVREAYRGIESSVAEKVGREHFQGVSVQPMIRMKDGYELIVGSTVDPQFGPVLLFGTGGQLVEVFEDRALGLPPLNTTLARRMIERTRIFRALQGVRGRDPVDIAQLEQLLVRFSDLVIGQPRIREIDINPLLASPDRLIALDARVVLHLPDLSEADLPRPAIRPYPSHYTAQWTTAGGEAVTIRPIRPEDEPMMVAFHKTLSDKSVYYRYFYWMQLEARIAHQRLTRMCFIDYDREMALVAERTEAAGVRGIVGVARMTRLDGGHAPGGEAEFAVIVSDAYQGHRLGTELLNRLVAVARAEGIGRLVGDILPENTAMQAVARNLGFRLSFSAEEGVVKAQLPL